MEERGLGPSAGARLVRGIAWNLLGHAAIVGLGLVATPFIVHRLARAYGEDPAGPAAFGVLGSLSLIAGYLNLMELGVAAGLVRHVAADLRGGRPEEAPRIVRAALGWLLAGGLLGGAALLILSGSITDRLLRPPPTLARDARMALCLTAPHFLAGLLLAGYAAVPVARERFDLANLQTLLLQGASKLGAMAALALGGRLPAVAAAHLAAAVLALGASYAFARRLLPGARLSPAWDAPALARLLRFGGWMAAGAFAVELLFPLNRLLILAFLPLASFALYQVPFDLAVNIKALANQVSRGFLPAASADRGDRAGAAGELLVRGTRAILLATLPFPIFSFLWGERFLSLWIGPAFAASAPALSLLAAGFTAYFATGAAGAVLQGIGRPRDWAVFVLAVAAANAALALAWIPSRGIEGAAAAFLAACLAGSAGFLAWAFRRLHPEGALRAAAEALLRPLFPAAILALGAALARPWAGTLPLLLLLATAGMALYGLAVLALALDGRDRRALAEALGVHPPAPA